MSVLTVVTRFKFANIDNLQIWTSWVKLFCKKNSREERRIWNNLNQTIIANIHQPLAIL